MRAGGFRLRDFQHSENMLSETKPIAKEALLRCVPVHQEQVVQNLGFRIYAEVRAWFGVSIYRIIYIMEN